MKLWQKSGTLNQQIEQFTIGKDQEFDLELAPYDILGSMAHAKMLAHIGLLTEEEEALLHQELQVLYEQAKNGEFQIEVGVEDVHSQVEFLLTQKLGDIGKKLHSGRSRNDQVLVDLRLFFRAKLEAIAEEMKGLFECLLEQSEKHKNVLMPGYTHMQVAMVSSFGLWFGAYAESLVDDLQQLAATYQIVN
ncbi:MAG: lyase family protein, partial [Bacteroidota bacterium]